ncbi:MAG TPA: hypothetical protein VNG33_05315 [Polyangiaceae bacterium]|nr:hypothetical protein [Polyangiaceae bacterium]
MLAVVAWMKIAAKRVTPAWLCVLAALVSGCLDNRNDVGYQLLASSGGSASSGNPGPSGAAAATTLPPLPRLTGVRASVSGDSVSITFEPLEGAVDYRVYALPPNRDISAAANGDITIRNAVYRCAGKREVPPVALDGAPPLPGGYIKTLVDGQDVNGYARSLAEATLGHVYLESGKDRVPVYALGDSDPTAENEFYFMRWTASRVKQYVTSETERDALLARGFRDDGIAFYVPAQPSAQTRWINTSTDAKARYYFSDGPEAGARQAPTQAFPVLANAEPGTAPLMRVFYLNLSNTSHDELVAGVPRFERARRQGDALPSFELHWSGLTEKTTLVVEALSPGCPSLPGLLSPISLPANATHPAWLTIDEARAVSPDGALYVNGQFAEDSRPRAVARAFVDVSPEPPPDLDWSWGFRADDALGDFTSQPCGDPSGNCYQDFRQRSDRFDTSFLPVETDRHVLQPMLGELWVMYADLASGVNGKFRLTPLEKAQITADAFLHVTMEVNAFTTARRYPQIVISDQDPPVQHTLVNGNALVIQPWSDWPNLFELQVCDHRLWEVNIQCPVADLHRYFVPNDEAKELSLAPHAEVGERLGIDRATRFEAYVSSERAYLLLDGQPYGCVDLPATGVPVGAVTVTFGDVLFHSDNDQLQFYGFVREHLYHDTQRHFDNLGFKSGVPAPAWNEARLPCVSKLTPVTR